MFAPAEMRKKMAAEKAAKQKAEAERQARINKGMLVGLKKPIADKTYVKGPDIKKTKAEVNKESVQNIKNKIKDVKNNPTHSYNEIGTMMRVYKKGNITVREPRDPKKR